MEVRCILKKILIAVAVLILVGAVAFRFNDKIFTTKDVLPDNSETVNQIVNLWTDDPLYTLDIPTKEELIILQAKLKRLEELERMEQQPQPIGKYAYIAKIITNEERALSALAIYHEARGESYEGQKAVFEVILNRMLSPAWPNTVKEILYQPGQFAVASYLTSADITEPELLAQAFDVVDEVLNETKYILPSENYVYFATSVIGRNPIEIGGHYFCE